MNPSIPTGLAYRMMDVADSAQVLLDELSSATWDITVDGQRCVGRAGRPLEWWIGALAETLKTQTTLVRLAVSPSSVTS